MQELIDSLSLCEMIQMIKGEGYAAIRFAIKQLTKEVEDIDKETERILTYLKQRYTYEELINKLIEARIIKEGDDKVWMSQS